MQLRSSNNGLKPCNEEIQINTKLQINLLPVLLSAHSVEKFSSFMPDVDETLYKKLVSLKFED